MITMNALAKITTMKALVYHGPGKKAFEDHPRPTIAAPTDAIVKITRTTICGTDLHRALVSRQRPRGTPSASRPTIGRRAALGFGTEKDCDLVRCRMTDFVARIETGMPGCGRWSNFG